MNEELEQPQAEEQKLPPMEDSWFDGEKESKKLEFQACVHELKLISATEARCTKCPAGWHGYGIQELVKASQLQTS